MRATVQRDFRPRPFEDGHALTFTVRELYDPAGEFMTQYHDRATAAYAFSLARNHGAIFAELRDQQGRVIADYARGDGTQWYTYAEGGVS